MWGILFEENVPKWSVYFSVLWNIHQVIWMLDGKLRIFCFSWIHLKSTASGSGKLRKHLSKSVSLLMSRPCFVKSKVTTCKFAFSGIGDTSHNRRHYNVLTKIFFLPSLVEMCGTCLGHVLDISSGWGHVLKSHGENWLAGYILCIFSFMCLQHVLRVSHLSSLPPGTPQNLTNQPNIPNSHSHLEDEFDSSI